MKRANKVIAAVLIAGVLGMFLVLPPAAEAGGRYSNHGHSHYSGVDPFWGGLAVGAVTGFVVGSVIAAPRVYAPPPPVVYQPAPVVYQPVPVMVMQPAPVCSNYWVNTYWNGYQWVPGYWAQACR